MALRPNAGNIAFNDMHAINRLLATMPGGRAASTAGSSTQPVGLTSGGDRGSSAPAPAGAPPARSTGGGGLDASAPPAAAPPAAPPAAGTGRLDQSGGGAPDIAPSIATPGGMTTGAGTGSGTFNAAGQDIFAGDTSALYEIYAQEQGWTPEGGNRALFQDQTQKAEAAWQLFASGDVAENTVMKEEFAREYLAGATAPGGSFYTEEQVREAVLYPTDSSFALQMQTATPEQQVSLLVNTYTTALIGTMPTQMLQARQAQLTQWGEEYKAWVYTNNTGAGMSFSQWLVANGKM